MEHPQEQDHGLCLWGLPGSLGHGACAESHCLVGDQGVATRRCTEGHRVTRCPPPACNVQAELKGKLADMEARLRDAREETDAVRQQVGAGTAVGHAAHRDLSGAHRCYGYSPIL